MPLDLADYEAKARSAVRKFWSGRKKAAKKQLAGGKTDQGERGAVTAGNNMNGFNWNAVLNPYRHYYQNGLERTYGYVPLSYNLI